jgi:hypothetical protein
MSKAYIPPAGSPPNVSGPAPQGGGSGHTVGKSESGASAAGLMKTGSSVEAGPQPTNQGADTTKALAEGGQIFSQGPSIDPVLKPEPKPTGGSGNLASDGTGRLPAAGQGSGQGLVTKSGITGKTAAAPRAPFGNGGFGGSK